MYQDDNKPEEAKQVIKKKKIKIVKKVKKPEKISDESGTEIKPIPRSESLLQKNRGKTVSRAAHQ